MSRRFTQNQAVRLAALLLLVLLLALPVLTYPLGRDQGEFATIGRGLLEGRVPYRDLWNPKPPAVFYVYAAAMALFGRSVVALRLLDLLIVPVISAALAWTGGRLANRRVGLWAALVFPVFYFTETFWTLTQNDGIALLPMTLAMACMVRS
ncbi:MAG: glycosyltransferase family 39 protein, partial [Chloroflexi bacterium]|nr:glycosyltransferase family 39 protein [Chloroflexota bacterium]